MWQLGRFFSLSFFKNCVFPQNIIIHAIFQSHINFTQLPIKIIMFHFKLQPESQFSTSLSLSNLHTWAFLTHMLTHSSSYYYYFHYYSSTVIMRLIMNNNNKSTHARKLEKIFLLMLICQKITTKIRLIVCEWKV